MHESDPEVAHDATDADAVVHEPAPPVLSDADRAAIIGAKRTLRTAVLHRRGSRSTETRAAADHTRTLRVQEFIGDLARPGFTVAAYLSTDDEPATLELISWLAAHELRVLLPVLGSEPGRLPPDESGRQAPAWAVYTGPEQLQQGQYGIAEPSGEVLPSTSLTQAHLAIVPGLAGNEYGHRLGRGGGWYDRALGHTDAVRLLLLNDDEVMPAIPVEPNDRHVDVIITERRTIRCAADTSENPDY